MPTRTAKAEWNGGLKSGKGNLSYGNTKGDYSFSSRMESGPGTNPEELLAAALAACYSMAFSADLEKAGFNPSQVRTNAKANFNNNSGNWTVETMDLEVEAKVPGIDQNKFQEIADGAKKNCPVSRALSGVKINLQAKLVP